MSQAGIALSIALLLSGCMGLGPDGWDLSSDKLDDLTRCDLAWNDGTPAPCTTNVLVLETSDGHPPPPWVCVRGYTHDDGRVWLYWHPSDRYAVAAAFEDHTGSPIGMFGASDAVEAAWYPSAGGTSHSVLPAGSLWSTMFSVGHVTFKSEDPRLQGALSVDIVTRGSDHAPIVHVAGDPSYHFSPLGSGFVAQFSFHGSQSLMFAGEDFDATVHIRWSKEYMWGSLPAAALCVL